MYWFLKSFKQYSKTLQEIVKYWYFRHLQTCLQYSTMDCFASNILSAWEPRNCIIIWSEVVKWFWGGVVSHFKLRTKDPMYKIEIEQREVLDLTVVDSCSTVWLYGDVNDVCDVMHAIYSGFIFPFGMEFGSEDPGSIPVYPPRVWSICGKEVKDVCGRSDSRVRVGSAR